MITALLVIGAGVTTALWTTIIILQFAFGEPTGRHSRFAPGAIPASEIAPVQPAGRMLSFQAYPVKAGA